MYYLLPDRLLTTVTFSLSITNPTGLSQGHTAGSTGPLPQGAPEPPHGEVDHGHQDHHDGEGVSSHVQPV